MAGGVAGRLEEPQPLGDLLVAGQRLEVFGVYMSSAGSGGSAMPLLLRDFGAKVRSE